MTTQAILSSAGLLIDIIGAVIVFYNGIPSPYVDMDKPSPKKVFYKSQMETFSRKETNRKVFINARLGMSLIIIGFILQLIGVNWMPDTT